MYVAVVKLQQVFKRKMWFYVDDKDEDWPDLIMSEKWLSREIFANEMFSAFEGERMKNNAEAQLETNDFQYHQKSMLDRT